MNTDYSELLETHVDALKENNLKRAVLNKKIHSLNLFDHLLTENMRQVIHSILLSAPPRDVTTDAYEYMENLLIDIPYDRKIAMNAWIRNMLSGTSSGISYIALEDGAELFHVDLSHATLDGEFVAVLLSLASILGASGEARFSFSSSESEKEKQGVVSLYIKTDDEITLYSSAEICHAMYDDFPRWSGGNSETMLADILCNKVIENSMI